MSDPIRRTTTHPSGQLAWEWFVLPDERQHGPSRQWNAAGLLIEDGAFEFNKRHGHWRKWYDNGQLAFEARYIRGLEDGTISTWDADGKLVDSYSMVRGTGVAISRGGWQGTWSRISYRAGEHHGPFEVFWPDGRLASRAYHFRGREVSKKVFAELSAIHGPNDTPPIYLEDTAAIEKLAKKIARPKKVSSTQAEQARKDDASCLEKLAAPDAEETLAWLAAATSEQSRTIGNCLSTEESRAMIEILYAAGAVRITVLEITTSSDLATTAQFVIELPEHREPRSLLLARCSLWATEQGFDHVNDMGQKYQFVRSD